MYPYGEHMSGWGYALGIIGMVLFWTVLVLAIAAAVRHLDRKRRESFPTVIIAGFFGDKFKQKAYFTAEAGAEKAPAVSLEMISGVFVAASAARAGTRKQPTCCGLVGSEMSTKRVPCS